MKKGYLKRTAAAVLAAALLSTAINTLPVSADPAAESAVEIQESSVTEDLVPEAVTDGKSGEDDMDPASGENLPAESDRGSAQENEEETAEDTETVTDMTSVAETADEEEDGAEITAETESEMTEEAETGTVSDDTKEADETETAGEETDKTETEAETASEETDEDSGILLMGISETQAKSNAMTIYDFLLNNMGFNSAAACGVLANIECESGFDPTSYYYGMYGLCQWTDDRLAALKKFCKNNGYDYTSLRGQLYYMKYELETDTYAGIKVMNYMKSVSNTADGAYNAAWYWSYWYERPADKESVSAYRGSLAQNTYWPSYGNKSAVSSGGTGTTVTVKVPKVTLKSVNNTMKGITVSWAPASSAKGYYVYRKASSDKDWVLIKVIEGSSVSSYEDVNVVSGQTYSYTVCAFSGTVFDEYVTTDSLNYRVSPGTSASIAGTLPKGASVRVYPGYSSSANGYTWAKIYYNGGTYYMASKYLKLVKAQADTSGVTLGSKASGKSLLRLAAPTLKKAVSQSRGIKVSWQKVNGAAFYVIYRKVSGSSKWKKLADIRKGTTVSYTDSTAVYGKTYVYTVKAGKGSTWSSYNQTGSKCKCKVKLVSCRTTDSLNYRKSPGMSGKIAGTLAKGKKVSLVAGYRKRAGGYDWCRICINKKFYYAARKYLKKIR